MLGSPIRTPPDHSSVANSPGLIAGSNVLHRLLMPRHPPCALHSLSHKHSTKATKTRRRTSSPSIKRPDLVRSGRKMLASTIEFSTCVLAEAAVVGDERSSRGRGCQMADSSGPNSVSGPVRSRCAAGSTPVSTGSTGQRRRPCRRFVDDSTSEHHRCRPVVRWACGVCAP